MEILAEIFSHSNGLLRVDVVASNIVYRRGKSLFFLLLSEPASLEGVRDNLVL